MYFKPLLWWVRVPHMYTVKAIQIKYIFCSLLTFSHARDSHSILVLATINLSVTHAFTQSAIKYLIDVLLAVTEYLDWIEESTGIAIP